jgi:hypothetical protein
MRLAISRSGVYHADFYCVDTRSAKRVLREHDISIVAIDYHLVGRDTGCDIIDWAIKNNVLPSYVVLIEYDRFKRVRLAKELKMGGYSSVDETTFIKH